MLIIINSVDTLPDNTISYYYLRQKLNKFWVEKQDFEVRCNDGLCKLNNHVDIANIPVPLQANLKSAVREIKTNYQIKTYISLIRLRRLGVIEQFNKLSITINTEIISKIEHQQYKTRCSGCTKY